MIEIVANTALCVAALGALTFVVSYHVLTSGGWRASDIGRNVMALIGALAILIGLGVLRAFVPWVDERIQWFRAGSFATVGYIVWRLVYLLFQAQRPSTGRGRREYNLHAHHPEEEGRA